MSVEHLRKQDRLAASQDETAEIIGCSLDHVKRLAKAGILDKRKIGPKKQVITWASIVKLIEHGISEDDARKMALIERGGR